MANRTCISSLQLCAIRVARLDPGGYVKVGANNLYETDIAVQLQVDQQIAAATDLELKNGCGTAQVSYFDCERPKRLSFNLELTKLDAELIELLTGATLITSAGDSVGFWMPATDANCPDGVSFEAWTRRWDGGQGETGRPYWHWGFAKTVWRMGQITMQNDIMRVPMVGQGFPNDRFANGPRNDWPTDIPHNSLGGVFADTVVAPTASCGRLTTPAQSGS